LIPCLSMYFRAKKTPTGTVLQLLQAYRNEQGSPRQRVVVSLGAADMAAEVRPVVARAVELRLGSQPDLLEPSYSESVRHWVDAVLRLLDSERVRRRGQSGLVSTDTPGHGAEVADGVILDKVEHERTTELGPQLVGLQMWRTMGMPALLQQLGLNSAQRVAAAVSVINRLVDPVSEHRLGQWVSTTALNELLGEDTLRSADDRFYRVSDLLYKHRHSIEQHLRQMQGRLFAPDRSVLLYDLTNTHFEGLCADNPKAKRGKNKQCRNDCPQIVVGMVFDRDGFVLTHRIFEGSQHDAKSLPQMVLELQRMLREEGAIEGVRPLVIVDGGIASEANLALLRSQGFDYLVNDSRPGRVHYAEAFAQHSEFAVVSERPEREPVMVRLLSERHGEGADSFTEQVVLCRSEARGAKESAMLSNAEQRLVAALTSLQARIAKGRLSDTAKVHQAIGRLRAAHPRVARYYITELRTEGGSTRLHYQRRDEPYAQAESLVGCYVLRTSRYGLDGPELWRLYMTLQRAEAGFRALKSQLGLRPNFHQRERRVEGHVFITVLAYHLQRAITCTLEAVQDMRSWETIRRLLRTHCYTTIVLPTRSGTIYRIRKPGVPEESQKAIYRTLGINYEKLPRTRTVHAPASGRNVVPIGS